MTAKLAGIWLALIPLGAYLLGSIPFGLLLGEIFGGEDVRKAGSGNIGATNVARVVGQVAGVLTLLLDAGKGAAAVWLAGRFSNESAVWLMVATLCVLPGIVSPRGCGFAEAKA